ncbi:MAG: STAS domain-containing protein [Armatimonadetes bacterium]|nr:STAS domain-containing protein [Armatimonadota bacterium]
MDVLHIGLSEVGGVRVLSLKGELDAYTSNRLTTLSKTWIPEAKEIIVSLDGLEYIDSSGLSALVGMAVVARENGVHMSVSCCNPRIHRVLELTGLINFFSMVGKASDAQPGMRSNETRTNDRLGKPHGL